MKRQLARISFAVAGVAASIGALAQSAAPTTDHPKAIGTSQATADEANRRAVQEGSTATVVRTGPSAADKASDAASSTKHAMTRTKNKVKAKTTTDTDNDTRNP